MSTESLKQAADILLKAKEDVQKVLGGTDNAFILLSTESQLNKAITRLQHLAGYDFNPSTAEDFPPVTNFMGEEIVRQPMLNEEDLSPEEADKAIYLEKVETLFDGICNMSPDDVLMNYTLPEDVLILRGVAKMAGVEDYETRDLDIVFVEEIQNAILTEKADIQTQEEIDEAVAAGKQEEAEDEPAPAKKGKKGGK